MDATRLTDTASLRGALDEIRSVASGGMSEIFRARQPSLDRYIIVKKLRDELLANPEIVQRFRREAKSLASVLHQNVAHVYDFVEGERESYILMEYIDGIDLSHVIEKLGNLPPIVAAAVALGVARGVCCIHAHNLIHRDIKPHNIRLTTRGEVKIMDFGIVADLEGGSLTRPGLMVGSPSYLSPEQVLGDAITPRADLFLVGICLYEMLTGTRPFKDEAGETVFQRIRGAKYIPARRMNRKVPSELDAIVTRCLERDPEKRFSSAKELTAALERFLGAEGGSHTEDILLQFLDREAVLTPAMPYSENWDRGKRLGIREWFRSPATWLLATLALGGMCLGYWAGSRAPRGGDVLLSFPPPKAALKH